HGDGLLPSERAYNRLRPLLRSPLAYRLYRNALPGDWAFRLARRIGRRGTGEPTPGADRELREAARAQLRARGATLAVLGHSHVPELNRWPEGTYLNTGYWFADRTFGRVADGAVALCRWAGGAVEVLEKAPLPARS
ncbi:MAG: UDP-2,3-diacylglucosamine diphosphatase, partial [Rhodothermales bacterium]|nr:UDP-2,3-diacylglucosamine diphosphatase [Rhodothermales bacterium]